MRPREIIGSYFLIQAVGTVAWWVLLIVYPPSVKWFQPEAWPTESLLSFWLADFALLIAGSVIAAIGVLRQSAWAGTVVWAVAVVTWYPTLVCIATSMLTGEGWFASSMMVSMSGLSLAMATIYGKADQSPAAIRVTAMNVQHAVLWTLGQTVIFWSVFLWVLPMGIIELERFFRINGFAHIFQAPASIGLFATASCVGLWSGFTMASAGKGTPLPTATAPQLVISGPYRFVRNPMAVAGIAQGLAVGWYLGSYAVLVYSLAGVVVWHIVVRPVEERDLKSRFGERYDEYQRRVRLWIPTFAEHSSENTIRDER